jgi:hypothetical protein
MTLQNDDDKGWWRNPMSGRARWIVVAAAVGVLVIVLGVALASGIPLF